jgi:hypothetical protein
MEGELIANGQRRRRYVAGRYIKFRVDDEQYVLIKDAAKGAGAKPGPHARFMALNCMSLQEMQRSLAALTEDVAALRRAVLMLADPEAGGMVDKTTLKKGLQMLLDALRSELLNQ